MCQWCLRYSCVCRWPSLSDIHLATLTGYAVYCQSPKSQVILHWSERVGDLPRWQVNSFDVLLIQLLLRQPYVVWTYGSQVTEVG
jgi:hypothetical protein